ncbi:MAG: NADAR family protein [Fibrobacterota bacterium]|nr:MAG: NADAR family protein [Fibrobacterota bacterium]
MVTTDKFVLFWGEEDIYSNFHPSKFELDGHIFHWSEQAFMWLKAMEFEDLRIANLILTQTPWNSSPLECKRMGREVSPFDDKIWSVRGVDAMRRAVHAKFSQNAKLREELLASGDRILAEASPYDRIWGIGYGESDREAQDPSKWRGRNLLGQVLMEVREQLR